MRSFDVQSPSARQDEQWAVIANGEEVGVFPDEASARSLLRTIHDAITGAPVGRRRHVRRGQNERSLIGKAAPVILIVFMVGVAIVAGGTVFRFGSRLGEEMYERTFPAKAGYPLPGLPMLPPLPPPRKGAPDVAPRDVKGAAGPASHRM